MPDRSRPTIGLRTGLIAIGIIGAAFLSAVFLTPSPSSPAPAATKPVQLPALESALPDAQTARFLRVFDKASPIRAQTLRLETGTALQNGADAGAAANMLLHALLYEFQTEALTLRYANVDDFDRLIAHLRTGFETLSSSGSSWCQATQVEALLKHSDTELIDVLLAEFEYPGPAYDWALQWGELYLSAAESARQTPTQHGPRSPFDKIVLQQHGVSFGAEQWTLALQIANFSQIEGQGHQQMREIIQSIDVCRLGIAIDDLSTRLPDGVRGRIWAELAPEIFYGNTPYVLYLVTDYFFLG